MLNDFKTNRTEIDPQVYQIEIDGIGVFEKNTDIPEYDIIKQLKEHFRDAVSEIFKINNVGVVIHLERVQDSRELKRCGVLNAIVVFQCQDKDISFITECMSKYITEGIFTLY